MRERASGGGQGPNVCRNRIRILGTGLNFLDRSPVRRRNLSSEEEVNEDRSVRVESMPSRSPGTVPTMPV